MLCMSIHGMNMFTEPIFYRGRHGQESEEGKEDREGSYQEGGKEGFKEKEVVVFTTETLRLRVLTRTRSKTFPKGLMSFAAVRFSGNARQGRIFVQMATA